MTEAHIIIEDIAQNDPAKHVKLISISGQLDESNIDEKAQEIYALLTQNPQGLYLIFDFEKLEYMNSKSIGYLTDWFGKVTEAQGKIVIVKARPNIVDILQVIGLTQLIPMYGTLEEAKFALLNTASTPAPTTTEPVLSSPLPEPTQAPAPIPPSTPAPTLIPEPEPTPAPTQTPEVVSSPVTMAPAPMQTPVMEIVPPPESTPVVPPTPTPTLAPEPQPTVPPAPEVTSAPPAPGTPS